MDFYDEDTNDNDDLPWVSANVNVPIYPDGYYVNAECNCDYHYDSRHQSANTYPYCPMKLVIRTNVPKLIDMASATVAVSLWKHLNILPHLVKANYTCAKDAVCWTFFNKKVRESSSQLPIPNSVREQIGEFIGKVQNEIIDWATYHFRSAFINRAKDYIVYSFIGDLIWNCDGTINCVETAKVISRSETPVVSDDEKCNFLCMYCLEDEMQPMVSVLSNIFQKCVNFERYPLIRYWSCYFNNELESIRNYHDLSLDCYMFRHRYVDNWPAKEYFFQRLSPEEQVRNAIWLIDNSGIPYQKILLKKLNDSQRVAVYMERSQQIIIKYVNSGLLTDAIETWHEVRNLVTRDQFVGLFSSLLRQRADVRMLTEIWTKADTDFKHHLFTRYNYEYTRMILNSFQWTWTNDIDFVTLLLKDLNAANLVPATKQIFIDFCEILCSKSVNFQWLDRLCDAYLGEDSKQQFKEDFVLNSKSIKSACLEYYSIGQLNSLNDTLADLFAQMPDRIPEYKRALLNSPDGISMCINVGFNTDSVNQIIADALPETNFAFELRKKIIFHASVIYEMKTMLAKKNLDGLQAIIDNFLISEQDKVNLKKSLLDQPSQLICDCFSNSQDAYLESLLLWVFKHQNLVDKFKETIPFDGIFDKMLAKASRVVRSCKMTCGDRISFECLDRFLIWRLGSSSEVKRYKLQRIYSYWGVDVITTLLNRIKRKSSVAPQRLQIVMKWFFENDSAEITKFNQTYRRDGIIAEVLQTTFTCA